MNREPPATFQPEEPIPLEDQAKGSVIFRDNTFHQQRLPPDQQRPQPSKWWSLLWLISPVTALVIIIVLIRVFQHYHFWS